MVELAVGEQAVRASLVLTLREGQLRQVYYPDLGTPALRDMEFVVTDGHGLVERSTDSGSRTVAPDPKVPAYRQEDTSPSGRWRMVRR